MSNFCQYPGSFPGCQTTFADVYPKARNNPPGVPIGIADLNPRLYERGIQCAAFRDPYDAERSNTRQLLMQYSMKDINPRGGPYTVLINPANAYAVCAAGQSRPQ